MISDITRTSKDVRCRSTPLSYLLVFVRYLIFVHAPLSYLVHVPFVHVPFVHVPFVSMIVPSPSFMFHLLIGTLTRRLHSLVMASCLIRHEKL